MLEDLFSMGFSLIPLHSAIDGKCSCGKADCGSAGKHPKTRNGVKDASNDQNQVHEWFSVSPTPNIGIATGEVSGIIVIDEDEPGAYFNWHIQNQKPTVPTWSVKTAKGTHYYFRFDERCQSLKNSIKFASGLDLRTTGGYIVGPGSVHVSGIKYEWINGPSGKYPLADLPDWMLDVLPKHDEQNSSSSRSDEPVQSVTPSVPTTFHVIDSSEERTLQDRAIAYLASCPEAVSGNSGSATTFKTCCRLMEQFGTLSDDEFLDALHDWNSRCRPSWTEKELRHKLTDARKKVKVQDTGLAQNRASVPDVTQTVGGSEDFESDSESDSDRWPVLDDDALHGIAGEIIRAIEPETEADPVGLLTTFLTAFGNAVGNRPYFAVGSDSHCGNLFSCIVGDTASGKGQSWGLVQSLMKKIDPDWVHGSISHGGMSSGEGFVERLQDTENADPFFVQPLKNVLFFESEFAKPIVAMRRESNTLSSVLRSSWDRSTLSILTRGKSKLVASNAFVSILAHITPEELRKLLKDSIESANGFSNRFLWCLVHSEKSLPHGGNVNVLEPFVDRLHAILQTAKDTGPLSRSSAADRLWESVYPELKKSGNGSYGRAIERARPQVLRLSLLYALLDSSNVIDVCHLKAALAVWRYCAESARLLFSDSEDPKTDSLETKILSVLADGPKTKTEIRNQISSSKKVRMEFPNKIDQLLKTARIVLDGQKIALPNCPSVHSVHIQAVDGQSGQNGQWTGAQPVHSEIRSGQMDKVDSGQNGQLASVQKPMDVADLLNWRNENGVQFEINKNNNYWVTTEFSNLLTPAIEQAIREHQDVLQHFVERNAVTRSVTGERTVLPKPKKLTSVPERGPEPETVQDSLSIETDQFFDAIQKANLADFETSFSSPAEEKLFNDIRDGKY